MLFKPLVKEFAKFLDHAKLATKPYTIIGTKGSQISVLDVLEWGCVR